MHSAGVAEGSIIRLIGAESYDLRADDGSLLATIPFNGSVRVQAGELVRGSGVVKVSTSRCDGDEDNGGAFPPALQGFVHLRTSDNSSLRLWATVVTVRPEWTITRLKQELVAATEAVDGPLELTFAGARLRDATLPDRRAASADSRDANEPDGEGGDDLRLRDTLLHKVEDVLLGRSPHCRLLPCMDVVVSLCLSRCVLSCAPGQAMRTIL